MPADESHTPLTWSVLPRSISTCSRDGPVRISDSQYAPSESSRSFAGACSYDEWLDARTSRAPPIPALMNPISEKNLAPVLRGLVIYSRMKRVSASGRSSRYTGPSSSSNFLSLCTTRQTRPSTLASSLNPVETPPCRRRCAYFDAIDGDLIAIIDGYIFGYDRIALLAAPVSVVGEHGRRRMRVIELARKAQTVPPWIFLRLTLTGFIFHLRTRG